MSSDGLFLILRLKRISWDEHGRGSGVFWLGAVVVGVGNVSPFLPAENRGDVLEGQGKGMMPTKYLGTA